MRIVVVGPGAMGSLLAAFLSKSKEEIWIFDKDRERAAKINQQGISLEGVSGSWQAKVLASSNPEDIGKADLVIISVESYNTKEAVLCVKDRKSVV